jgi:hypothetical protein
MWPNWVMPHSFLHSDESNPVKFCPLPIWSHKLASEVIVDPWNASELLHVLYMRPAKDFTKCCFCNVAQLGHATQLFAF